MKCENKLLFNFFFEHLRENMLKFLILILSFLILKTHSQSNLTVSTNKTPTKAEGIYNNILNIINNLKILYIYNFYSLWIWNNCNCFNFFNIFDCNIFITIF